MFECALGREKYSYGKPEFMLMSKETEEVKVGWDALLENFHALERLDLKLVPLESKHLPLILKAAGNHCLQLEALVLPRKPDWKKAVKGEKIGNMLKELYSAVEQFYVKGGLGRLRQLTVPSRNGGECCRSSTEFLEHVTKFCPNIEYLDGAEKTFHGHYGVRCDDKWMISLETWEEFNKTCTKLREFHWSSVPFADPFFRVFGKYPKPQLKKLTITANLLWSWSEYFKECDETTKKAIKHCHAKYAREIDAVFKAALD